MRLRSTGHRIQETGNSSSYFVPGPWPIATCSENRQSVILRFKSYPGYGTPRCAYWTGLLRSQAAQNIGQERVDVLIVLDDSSRFVLAFKRFKKLADVVARFYKQGPLALKIDAFDLFLFGSQFP